ncbi:hypothetical protein V8C37DRAFT_48645 [Trichoderma ceciliae]
MLIAVPNQAQISFRPMNNSASASFDSLARLESQAMANYSRAVASLWSDACLASRFAVTSSRVNPVSTSAKSQHLPLHAATCCPQAPMKFAIAASQDKSHLVDIGRGGNPHMRPHCSRTAAPLPVPVVSAHGPLYSVLRLPDQLRLSSSGGLTLDPLSGILPVSLLPCTGPLCSTALPNIFLCVHPYPILPLPILPLIALCS